MLRAFGAGLWLVDGPEVVAALGFRYPTRMAIIRLADGGLFIWSPVSLDPSLRTAVDALGTVNFIVAPSSLHHVFIPDWHRAYPQAEVFGAPGVARKRHDVSFDGVLRDVPVDGWAGQIDQVLVAGNALATEVVFFHRASGTALFTDLLQNMAPEQFSGWRKVVARLDLMTAVEPSVPRKFRVAFTDRKAARAAIARVRAWPVERVVMAHGTPVSENGADVLARAFAWL